MYNTYLYIKHATYYIKYNSILHSTENQLLPRQHDERDCCGDCLVKSTVSPP